MGMPYLAVSPSSVVMTLHPGKPFPESRGAHPLRLRPQRPFRLGPGHISCSPAMCRLRPRRQRPLSKGGRSFRFN